MPKFKRMMCGEVIAAETREALLDEVSKHAWEAHGLEVTPEIREVILSKIEE